MGRKHLIMENVYYDGSQTMNVAENAALGGILKQLRTEIGEMAQ